MGRTPRKLEGASVLITGTNRGLGQALVEEALNRGASRVYAAARKPITHDDARVTPVRLDVTSAEDIESAAEIVESLDILVNNAGLALSDDLRDRATIERHLDVNLFGPNALVQAFQTRLVDSGGSIVNVLSVAGVAALPFIPSYSLSKAAALVLSQSLRALLAPKGVDVHVVLAGPIDTDMSRDLPVAKASPGSVARAIFDGLERGEEDIFPDPLSQTLADSWRASPVKEMERQNAALVATAA
ncbi:MAG TPA: SDR family NAD(P)-dependent oxidoreductase [Solirubrobacteraceae bacterium]